MLGQTDAVPGTRRGAGRVRSALGLLTCALLAAGCAGPGGDAAGPGDEGPSAGGGPATAPGTAELTGTLTVLAAASLTDAMAVLEERFEAEHPRLEVVPVLGGSSALAAQVLAGSPADVLVTASPTTMATVVDAGAVDGEPVVVATNALRIAVPRGNPGGVTGLADLADPDRTVALCAPQVPCGAAAEQAFAAAGLVPAPDTLEQDVRAVLTKVVLGEVDAGLVYVTDVLAAGPDVAGIDLPPGAAVTTGYPAAVLAEAPSPAAAAAFVGLLTSDAGQAVLRDAGFGAP